MRLGAIPIHRSSVFLQPAGEKPPSVPFGRNLLRQKINKAVNNTATDALVYGMKKSLKYLEYRLINPPVVSHMNSLEALPKSAEHIKDKIKVVKIKTEDGVSLKCWDIPAQKNKPTVIFCHGDYSNLVTEAPRIKEIADSGYGVLAVEYRGYAGNSGIATEEGLSKDVQAAFDYVKSKGTKKVGVFGHSLGGAVAIDLAAKKPVDFLIVENTFTDFFSVGKHLASLPALPPMPKSLEKKRIKVPNIVRRAFKCVTEDMIPLKNRFKSVDKIREVKCPTYIVHSKEDKLIPSDMSEILAQKRGAGAFLDIVENGDHFSFDSRKKVILEKLSLQG